MKCHTPKVHDQLFVVVYTFITPLSTDLLKIKIEQPGDRRGFGHVERGPYKGQVRSQNGTTYFLNEHS
jgi:hypothetical protein